jgi:hypothetical protein
MPQWVTRRGAHKSVVKTDLNELLDSHEALFQGIKGGGVEHLLLDLGRVRTPGHQEQLLLLAGL